MAELTTVPMFVFYQGEFMGEDWELPIEVKYYDGLITIEQQGNGSVKLKPAFLNQLFKEIKKHLPEAEKNLKL